MITKIYEALYNPMTEESGYMSISLHSSKEGVELAIEKHKSEKYKKWEELCKMDEDGDYAVYCPFAQFEDWCIRESEILP